MYNSNIKVNLTVNDNNDNDNNDLKTIININNMSEKEYDLMVESLRAFENILKEKSVPFLFRESLHSLIADLSNIK